MKEWGLQQPIVCSPVKENGDREVYAGNRRIKAARRLDWKEIEAFELTQDPNNTIDPRVLAEQMNSTAKPNPVLQLEAIETLLEKGYSEKQISAALKLKLGTVRARMRLRTLHPTIRSGVKRNKVSFGNADRIAKMSEATQERLAKRFEADGKLPWSVIDEERRKKVDEVTDAFDIDLDGMDGAEAFAHTVAPQGDSAKPAPQGISDEERERLGARIKAVLEDGKKPSWSKADADAVAKLLGLE
jgi:ParB/RepB/Spo0J family partition protein